ncbi:hypothetical protein EYR36_005057 [Pleurotus pulmonarius]|nr:hypothetical protein EYR36_005057 [Pleurotus pulmonarius]
MGLSLSSSAGSSAPAPVYSGIDKLTTILEGADDGSGTSPISQIAIWKDTLSTFTEGLRGLPVPDRCHVVAMHICKETILVPYHEMLLFEIATEENQKYFLRVDRFVSNPNMTMFAESASNAHLIEKKNVCLAEHQAQIAHRAESIVGPDFQKARSAFFNHKPASFRRLLDLLALVTEEEYGDYNLWDRSCYWFSSVVYRTFRMDFQASEEIQGPAYPNLGKFARRGNGVDHLSVYLNDNGKLYDAWQANKSAWTPIARFLCKEKGKGVVKYDTTRNAFIVATRTGLDFVIFSGEGLSGDDRPGHIAKGPYSADLSGRLINITCHGSSPVDLRFKTRDEAKIIFTAMRCLMNDEPFAIYPTKILVDRRHSSMLISQSPSCPGYLEFSSHALPRHPNLRLFKPLDLKALLSDKITPGRVESYQPLSLAWRDAQKSLVWKREFVLQTSEGTPDDSWTSYWESYFSGKKGAK